jgi:hypothetical protein
MYLSQVRQEVHIERREPLKATETIRRLKRFLKKEDESSLPPSVAVHLMQIKESAFLTQHHAIAVNKLP